MSGKQDGEIYETQDKFDVIKDGSCSNVFMCKHIEKQEKQEKAEKEDNMDVMHTCKTRYIKTRRRENKADQSDIK